jgi:hydrogenase large subunit
LIKLIEKIEGEAKLNFSFDKDNKIDFVDIEFFSTRNIEQILEGRDALDALVINPRVCGICGHAHLIATAKALESCYKDIKLSNKAKIIRELTLNFEIIQNHFKWFYLTILPLLGEKQHLLKATAPSQIMAKAIATLAGQYPHTSYAIVGGVVSDISMMDIIKV